MHPSAQHMVLKNHMNTKPFASVSIAQALCLLKTKSDIIQARLMRTTDEQINHMLTLSDIETCNTILKDIQ